MALRNLNLDAVIHGVQHANLDSLDAILVACESKMAECGLTANDKAARTKLARHGRGNRHRGQRVEPGNFSGRDIVAWIESVPVTGKGQKPTADVASAYESLVTIHATVKARVA